MLSENITLRLGARKNTNVKSTGYNKYYLKIAYRNGGLTQRGFIDHVAEHCIGVPRAMVSAVISQLSECIPELISQGTSVKIDRLGVFIPYVGSKGVANPADYNVRTDITGLRMRLRPDSTKLDDLTSKNFKDMCQLSYDYIWGVAYTRGTGAEAEDVYGWVDIDKWEP